MERMEDPKKLELRIKGAEEDHGGNNLLPSQCY